MAATVSAVNYPGFVVPALTSSSTDVAKRTRVRIPVNQPGTYSHNAQSSYPYRAIWDISDAENFLDTRSLEISFSFKPLFFKDQQKTMAYQAGASPCLDQDTQAMVFRLTVGNAQGVLTEDFLNYNLFTNMVQSFSENPNHKNFAARHFGTTNYRVTPQFDALHLESGDDLQACFNPSMYLTEPISAISADGSYYPGTMTAAGQAQDGQVTVTAGVNPYNTLREVLIQLSNSSFLNRVRYLPLFVMRNGLRITVEFENPAMCFYNQFSGSQNLGYPAVQFVPMVQADWTSYAGAISGAQQVYAPYTQFPQCSLTQQGWNKLHLKVGDRIAMVFGFNNSIASSEQYVTGFGTVLQVGLPAASSASTSLLSFEGADSAVIFSLTQDILQLNVTTGAGGIVLTAAELFSGAKNTLFKFLTGQSIGGVSTPAIGLLGLLVEKTHSPYIFPATLTAADVYATLNTKNTKFQTSVVPVPGFKLGNVTGALNYYIPSWNYEISNLEMLCDFVKPSAMVFQQYVQQFSSESGIAYPFTRVLYHSYLAVGGSANTYNIQIPFQVRSLRGIMIAITDKASVQTTGDATCYNYPAKSSFMTRGLQYAQLFVGAQTYPARRFDFTQGVYTVAQLNELESMLGVLGNPQYTPQFIPSKLKKTSRDYARYGSWDQTWVSGGSNLTGYRDTSKFVLAFNTQKIDGDFASGVDTSQSVSIILNMILGQHALQRDRLIHIFGICDAVVTFQNDATLVRY